ncbi:hypothetical protein KIH74_29785 [Kineosporia sp. J2-2]|uniref:Uncharacterized protein n=1 Tax=Kineosporia corallincola TaxID=2835133 RepID=A0ABS5TQ19_9ACTN|nr:hypothetical protein [Kineosporia corallincola]MBT0773172.1 hypothetical protein [Kineosporia corallincola]
MPDRFSLGILFRDHWRSLVDVRTGNPDYVASAVLILLPLGSAGVMLWKQWSFGDVGTFVAAVTLLAGVLFAAFTQLTAMRMRLDEPDSPTKSSSVARQFREAAAHTLVGSVLAGADAAIFVLATAIRKEASDNINIVLSAMGVAVSVYLMLIFILVARRMYAAYLTLFEQGKSLPPRRKIKP